MRSSVWLLVSSSSSCSSQHVSFKFIITPITIILRYFNICCCCPVYCCSNLIVISSFLKTFFILSAYLSTAAAALGRIFEVTRLFDWWGGGCGITGICVNPHIWTFDSCSRAGMDMSSWDWWGWRRVMTDSQTWKKLESQRCQNTGCGGWLGWARQTLEYQVTDKTNQCLPKHSNISDSILLNVKASSHSMLFLGFIKTFLQEVLTYSLSNLWSTVPTIIFESFASYHSAAGCILVFWKGRDNRFSTFWSNPALGGKMV